MQKLTWFRAFDKRIPTQTAFGLRPHARSRCFNQAHDMRMLYAVYVPQYGDLGPLEADVAQAPETSFAPIVIYVSRCDAIGQWRICSRVAILRRTLQIV